MELIWVRLGDRNEITGQAIAPPSSEAEYWEQIAADDPRMEAFLNPPPPPVRNWARFQAQGTIASLPVIGFNAQTAAISSVFVVLLSQVSENEAVIPNIIYLWNAMAAIAHPNEATIANLRQLAAACNLPLTLDDRGMMMATTT